MPSYLAKGAGALAVVLTAAACGSGSSASSDSAASSSEGKAGLQRAADYVKAHSSAPTDLALPALTKKPKPGVLFVTIENPIPTAVTKDDATEAAAKALGWTYKRVTVAAGPEGPAKAMQQAVAMKPQYIGYSGTPAAALRQGIADATKAHIKIVPDGVTDPITPTQISSTLDGTPDITLNGEAVANYAIAKSQGKAHILIVDIPAFPILGVFRDSIKATVKKNCPGCKVSVIDTQITDIGTKNPASVVSAVQKDPTINYVYFGFGDIGLGVPAALKAASLAGKVKIGGETPAAANLAALKTGTEEVWTGFPIGILGYKVADMAARDSVGDDLAPAEKAPLPSQLLNKDNIGNTPLDKNGAYIGIPDYDAQFKKLWLVQ